MKRQHLLFGLILAGVGILAACNSDSPTAPPATPTPTAYTMVLTATPGQALVGSSILFQATVSSGSGVVADGTSVTFTVSGCVPGGASDPAFENGTCEIVRTTSAGRATATLTSNNTAGSFQVVARVPQKEASTIVTFSQPVTPDTVAIYSITPNRGRPEGGEQVVIRGRGFATPVTVDFRIGNANYHAQVLSVSADGTQIQAVTPALPQDATDERIADLVVTAAAGTPGERSDTMANAFTYERPVSEPRIYSLAPSRGAWSGGEQVIIYGAKFFAPVRVFFGGEEAEVASISADKAQIVVITPRHSGSITAEQPVDVTVRTRAETTQQQQVTLANGFTYVPDSGDPVLYAVLPSQGSPRGGEQVVLTGKNFTPPVLVEFLLGAPLATTLPAEAVTVNAAGTQITLRTPQASPTPVTTDVPVSIRITNLVGAPNSRSATFTNVFTYIGESRPPLIYYLQPDRGSARGGEQVVIHGRFFLPPVNVVFAPGGAAEVTDLSADGERVTIITPAISVLPLAQDTPANITVTTQYGTGRESQVTLNNGFLYIAEQPAPEIYSLTPNSGPIDGGTRVTITGRGFQYPVEVTFEYPQNQFRQAQVVSVNFTTVVCIAPSVAPAEPDTPAIANVRVTNVTTGRVSNTLPFRYGEAMFISAISPNQGSDRGGDQVTIYGQGFTSPVAVTLAGVPAEPLTVGGTLINVRTGRVPNRSCSPRIGPSQVVNINSNLTATGPNFTYQPAVPFVTSVSVAGVDASGNTLPAPGTPCASGDYRATVNGFNFETLANGSSAMRARLGTTPPIEVATTWVSENQLTFIFPNLSAFTFDQVPCVDASGAAGVRWVPTPVNLTLTNIQNSCTDTLNSAFIIRPCDTSCRVSAPPTLTLSPASLSLPAGTQGNMTVTISQTQLVATPVTLASSAPAVASVPTTVTIPAGLTSATFQVTGVSPGGPVGITASVSLPGVTPANASVTVTNLSITLSPAPLDMNGPVGSTATMSVQLGAAVASPVTVTLNSANPGVVSVPASVTVPANTTTANFTVTKAGTSAAGVTVTATLPAILGGSSSSATVNAPALALTLSVPPPPTLYAGSQANGTVTISHAQTTSTVVQLQSSNPGWASVPASVTIPAGSTAPVNFPVTGVATDNPEPSVNITASVPAIPSIAPVTGTVTVKAMSVTITPATSNISGPPGSTVTLTLTLDSAAAPSPITVNLSSSNPGLVSVPASVTVPINANAVTFQATRVGAGTGTATIGATLPAALNPAAPPHDTATVTVP